jgi:hypothetical protein
MAPPPAGRRHCWFAHGVVPKWAPHRVNTAAAESILLLMDMIQFLS